MHVMPPAVAPQHLAPSFSPFQSAAGNGACFMGISPHPQIASNAFVPGTLRYFMSASTPPSSAGSAGAPGGAADGGSDGQGGGKKRGRAFLDHIFLAARSLTMDEQLSHVAFARAQGRISEEDLKCFFQERLEQQRFVDLRHELLPDLVTDGEVVARAIAEVQDAGMTEATLQELRLRDGLVPEGSQAIILPGFEGAGAIMRLLMERFIESCEPRAPHRRDRFWHSGPDYVDPHRFENAERDQAYSSRKETRPAIAQVMAALNRHLTSAFMGAVRSMRLQSREDMDQEQLREMEGELHAAALAAMVSLGGRELLELIPILEEELFCERQHGGLSSDFDIRGHFGDLGALLARAVNAGEIVQETAQGLLAQTVQNALARRELKGQKMKEERILHPEYRFSAIGKVGFFAASPLCAAVREALLDDDPAQPWKQMTLRSLMDAVWWSAKHLQETTPEGISYDAQLGELVAVALLALDRERAVFPYVGKGYSDDRIRDASRRAIQEPAERILLTLMRNAPSQLVLVLARDARLGARFLAWQEGQLA